MTFIVKCIACPIACAAGATCVFVMNATLAVFIGSAPWDHYRAASKTLTSAPPRLNTCRPQLSQVCEAYPEESQQAPDAWVESFDTYVEE